MCSVWAAMWPMSTAVALEAIGSRHLPISIDTNRALARACVDYWQQHRG